MQRKKKRKNTSPLRLVALVAVLVVIVICTIVILKYSPSREMADLEAYYGLTSSGDTAVVINNELLSSKAIVSNDKIYLDIDAVQEYLNQRFYWDANEMILIYTTSSQVIKASVGTANYYQGNTLTEGDYIIVKYVSGTAYVCLDFVAQYTDMDYTLYDDPARVVVRSDFGETTYVKAKRNAKIRVLGGVKSEILTKCTKGQVLTVLETYDHWTKVATEDGIIGYVSNKKITASYTETEERDFEEETYSSITKDFDINLTWHQVTNQTANSYVSSVLSEAEGVNVLAPTWFALSDTSGNIASLANSSYVTTAHESGVEVWAVVSNLTYDVDTTEVLTHTTLREHLESQIIAAAIEYKLDGINVDFEDLSSEVDDSYIQFIRELSILCRNNGIVLSVDTTPTLSTTAFYNREEMGTVADYVVLMAYDEHYSGSEVGSVASISWTEESVATLLNEVPAEKLILGVPYYTRLWMTTTDSEGNTTVDSEAVGMSLAQSTLTENGQTATYDEASGQNYAEWTEGDTLYQIWLEDATSMESRMQILTNNGLAGCASWRVGYETSDIWGVLNSYLN